MDSYSKLLTSLFVATTLALSACEPSEGTRLGRASFEDDDMYIRNQGIIGGAPTGTEDWRGVVAIVAGYGSMCSGTLIHPQVVLTAGHCVKLNDPTQGYASDYTQNPGAVRIRSGGSVMNAMSIGTGETIIAHPSWTGMLTSDAADIALIKLRQPTTAVEPYGLRDFPVPQVGEKAKLVGYGGTGGAANFGSGTRRAGDTTLLNVDSNVIETGNPANTCQGDSGGPMFTEQNGEWVVAGVTSFGTSQLCYKAHGSYSVNVVAYCNWIDETMRDLVGEGLGLAKCSNCTAKKTSSWGQPCGQGYEPCPANTHCRAPTGYSNGTLGYCAADCCDFTNKDAAYCTDISSGAEQCGFVTSGGSRYCAINCASNEDCPSGLSCKSKPFGTEKICIATSEGPGGPGTTTDVDIDMDADTDTDGDSQTDSDADTDTPIDEDTSDGETDDDTIGDKQNEEMDQDEEDDSGSPSGCNVSSGGRPSRGADLIRLFGSLAL